jgi:hypothetical protein
MRQQRDSIRRQARDPLVAVDLQTNEPLGQVINMSYRGMKLMTEHPVKISKVFYCRILLPDNISDVSDINVDAECRWCKKNEQTGWYDSGYLLRKVTEKDTDVIKLITRRWMIEHSESLNEKGPQNRRKKRHLFSRIVNSCLK